MSTYVLVSGDFTPWGGMDIANYHLALFLAAQPGARVHLVSHRVAPPLGEHPAVTWHRVPRPFGRHALGGPLLRWAAGRIARRLAPRGAHVIVNGGNCAWPGTNWVHAVHAVWDDAAPHAPAAFRMRAAIQRWAAQRDERRALRIARVVVTNSRMARRDLVEHVGLAPERVHVVEYGTDPTRFRQHTDDERRAARKRLGWPMARPVAALVGGLGHDRRKGMHIAFAAWEELCADPAWDVDLVAAGGGAEVALWRARAATAGLADRVRVLGFTTEVPTILAAADAFVSPTRYESYGLGVHEALCCGLPAFVTRTAGVAERYPSELADLLLDDPPTAAGLAAGLRRWRADMAGFRARVALLAATLRERTWDDMSRDIAALVEASDPTVPA